MTDGLILIKPRRDLSGEVFNNLLVLRQGPDLIENGNRKTAWWCKCSCGNPEELLIRGNKITSGEVKSCGCLNRSTQFQKVYNEYDLDGDCGIGYTGNGIKFYFDKEDYNLIKNYCWCYLPASGYIVSTRKTDTAKHIFKAVQIHRLIMGVLDIDWKQCIVDHINGNKLDNRKSNLRLVDCSQSVMNIGLRKNNTSGVTGVSRSSDGKWVARIDAYKKQVYLGRFTNFEDAVKARKDAEEKYFGEYSYDNSKLRGEAVAVN